MNCRINECDWRRWSGKIMIFPRSYLFLFYFAGKFVLFKKSNKQQSITLIAKLFIPFTCYGRLTFSERALKSMRYNSQRYCYKYNTSSWWGRYGRRADTNSIVILVREHYYYYHYCYWMDDFHREHYTNIKLKARIQVRVFQVSFKFSAELSGWQSSTERIFAWK